MKYVGSERKNWHEKKSVLEKIRNLSGWRDGSALASVQERTAFELQRLERIGHGWGIEDGEKDLRKCTRTDKG